MALGDTIKTKSLGRFKRWPGMFGIAESEGATVVPLSAYEVEAFGLSGGMMPPLQHSVTDYAVEDGAALHGVAADPRPVVLRISAPSVTSDTLVELLGRMVPDRIGDESAPFYLYYYGPAQTVRIAVVLTALPDFPDPDVLILRFVAYAPYWEGVTIYTESLAFVATPTINYVAERSAAGAWSGTSAGPGGAVNVLSYGPDGKLYAGLNAAPGLKMWDGVSWSTVAGGTNGAVLALLWVGTTLYVGGSFTQVNGAAASRIARLDTATTTPTWDTMSGNPITSGDVRALAPQLYGGMFYIIIGGSFNGYLRSYRHDLGSWWSFATTNGAVNGLAMVPGGVVAVGAFTQLAGVASLNRVAQSKSYSSWQALGVGFDEETHRALCLPDGRIVVGSQNEFSSGSDYLGTMGIWNGSKWSQIGNDGAQPYGVDADGVLWMTGYAWSGCQTWNGSRIHAEPIELAYSQYGAPTVLAVAPDGRIALGNDVAGTGKASGRTVISTGGTATTVPTIVVSSTSGTATLDRIENLTSGDVLYFDTVLIFAGEVVTLDLAARTATSNIRGPVLDWISPDSNFGTFRLLPGDNEIAVYCYYLPDTMTISYRPRFWTLDGGQA